MNTTEKILRYKSKIKNAETELHQAEGSQKEILRSLKDMDLKDIQAAGKEIKLLDDEILKLEDQEQELIQELEEEYNWN